MAFPKPFKLLVDNTTAEAFGNRSVNKSKLKHIDCRQEWVLTLRDKSIVRLGHEGSLLQITHIAKMMIFVILEL